MESYLAFATELFSYRRTSKSYLNISKKYQLSILVVFRVHTSTRWSTAVAKTCKHWRWRRRRKETALEENSKVHLLIKQVFHFCPLGIEFNISNGASFWTSGSSDKCPNSYGWCGTGEKELISFKILELDQFLSSGGKECVSATLDKSDLVLQADSCATKKRYICEV
jgi:hypothetical protein